MVGLLDARNEEEETDPEEYRVHKVVAIFEGRRIETENPFRSENAAESYVAVLESHGAENAHYYTYTDKEHVEKREERPDEWEATSVK